MVEFGLLRGEHQLQLPLDHRGHQVGLAVEIVIHLALAGARGGQHVVEAGGAHAVVIHQRGRGVHDLCARTLTARDRGRCHRTWASSSSTDHWS